MTTIFDEFRLLAPTNGWRDVIDLIENGNLEQREKRELAFKVWKACLPVPPQGHIHRTNSVWRCLADRVVWMGLCGVDPEKKASYMRMHRERSATWPQPGQFQKIPSVPLPRDGKDGANGWMPRTG